MKKWVVVLSLMLLSATVNDFVQLVVLILLISVLFLINRHINEYLQYRRFKQDCDELFTEEFYVKLSDVIKNEFT